ncbi:Protein FAN [Eumeta japonica]|uniref:Protein FAN n=1 Tax=Eumeta variegata TaxID=151549 RepID=A0A4C1Y5Z2_EUMVA|nr:Protein FAN [Eumeta japonica]
MRHGRLKLCSKSLIFEPKEWTYPLLKLHFKDCTAIAIVDSKTNEDPNDVIKIAIKQYTEMLEDNVLAPYKFKYEQKEVYFKFDFAVAEDCLHKMHQLQRASMLHPLEHNSMVATISHSLYMRMAFDPVMMEDFTEKIILELQAEKITPLVRHQGKLALTPTTLYFQPFNNIDTHYLKNSEETETDENLTVQGQGYIVNAFNTSNQILSIFAEWLKMCVFYPILTDTTLGPQAYQLLALEIRIDGFGRSLADRSKNDLTQYPVFPWIISDYKSDELNLDNADIYRDLSKPIGALNPDRLDKLKERYEEMCDPKFLYGSHYSAPGLVLFYLVRKYPQYMLCLQNGRFDHPDRMFNSVYDVYNNCLKNMSDFKELVPEFYDIEGKVHNVALPPWANSPEDFVRKLRSALESEYVSRHLHQWIDLIFGYKQRGEEAVRANNVFHHVCYEGSIDLECIEDMNERHAFEVQIMEFGQVPKQLFTRPHVRRITHEIPNSLTVKDTESNPRVLELVNTIQLHREEVMCVILEGDRIISVGKDGTLKVYSRSQKKQIRSVSLCGTPLSSCVMISENTVAVGSWDNEIYLYDVEYGRIIESFRAHDDSVSCLTWLKEERVLISGGWDCVVRAWRGAVPALRGLTAELDHDAKVTALTTRLATRIKYNGMYFRFDSITREKLGPLLDKCKLCTFNI